ncbi:hypothetical protein SAMN05216226_1119 [Halovenus aranensis]|uniref:Uncharacterized protein n=1 Tax=Halovenus aranensis TaxID=890420 RepID=A0A1G8XD92_9EURY|nr:hypothetical protein [Halovenus aranensis]SDJ88441.1 hypothetical protein SAMN05216226_1119 [Halovenus aranensis]
MVVLSLFGASLVAVSLAIVWYSLRQLVVVPKVVRTAPVDPSSVIESGTDGAFVVCRGTTAPADKTVAGPFTGTRCLGFEFAVSERQPSGIGIPWGFAHLDDGVATLPFRLTGERGSLRVEPSPRRFSLDTASTVVTVGARETPPDRIASFVDGRDALSPVADWLATIPGMGTRQYVERRVESDEEYTVAGRIERQQGTPALTGSLVITDKSPTGFALARLKAAVLPLVVAVFLGGAGAVILTL